MLFLWLRFSSSDSFAYKTVEEGGIWEDGDLRKEEALRYDLRIILINIRRMVHLNM